MGCKCDEIGDYSKCSKHGDYSEWAKAQGLKGKMNPTGQEASCFMCQKAGKDGCLECRFNRLSRDIRNALYERLGAEQHAAEWEERGVDLESKLAAHIKNAKEWQAESMEYAKDNATLRERVIELERQLTVRIDMINELRAAK